MAFVEPDSILEYAKVKKVISTDKAPAAIGPYSQAIQAGEFLYVSGQIPVDPSTGNIPETISAQAEQSLTNLKNILSAAGYLLSDVVKTTVFVTDISNFAEVNEIYAKYFDREAPARSFVAVKDLPKGVGIEIEAVAWRRKV
ncbi:MAG: RidA family protein [Synergistaceae bacterium]|nr:RidA family protein [Synergistaceae bacterium]MBQ7067845.1 RidA family protein [Synergistaceae bacterium]MBR0074694.1 RidA family protein [Synergistaceae bacterium]MBR0252727.1 RidA family protein [Synergistaceae bacterium]MBR0317249.1 RidA family protein [Synergistaceae bacterium]